jgi:hypothetical protein
LSFVFWFYIIPVLALFGLMAFALLEVNKLTRFAAELFGIECALVFLAVYVPVRRYYLLRKSFKQMFPAKRTDPSSSIDIDDECIAWGIPGISEAKFTWAAIIDFAQDENITLLYLSKKGFLFFPTPALMPEQRTELTAMVRRHIEGS